MDKTKGKKPIKSFYQEEALGPSPFWEELQMNSFTQNRQGGFVVSHYQGYCMKLRDEIQRGRMWRKRHTEGTFVNWSSNYGYHCLDPIGWVLNLHLYVHLLWV